MTRTQKTQADITALLRARNALLWIVTREEERAEATIFAASAAAGYPVYLWDCAAGLTEYPARQINPGLRDPAQLVRTIRESADRRVYVLRDAHTWLRDPITCRALKNSAHELPRSPRDQAKAIVIIAPTADIPPELAGDAIVIDYPLPEREEIAALLDRATAAVEGAGLVNGARDAAIDAAIGLTAVEAERCYAGSLVRSRQIDVALVSSEKRNVIAREKVLTWHDPDPRGLAAVGGLELLKEWLRTRRSAFSAKARDFGLTPPRGVMLVGVPGCGKSLTAKAIAAAWQMPLLRLDMGALKAKFVGESEGNIRRALALAETVSPCILWADEIEKALSGATSGSADGGVSADALGTLLSWMQERVGSVFVIATANNVEALPPELLRKGRFDELFFVDLPTSAERASIIETAILRAKRDSRTLDLQRVALATDGFTGAELAELVPDALYAAFADGERDITTADLLTAAESITPLAKTAAEKISTLRNWAKGRARPASAPETVSASNVRALDL